MCLFTRFFPFWWSMMLGAFVYLGIVLIHNRIVKEKCAAESEDQFKAYECLQKRKW